MKKILLALTLLGTSSYVLSSVQIKKPHIIIKNRSDKDIQIQMQYYTPDKVKTAEPRVRISAGNTLFREIKEQNPASAMTNVQPYDKATAEAIKNEKVVVKRVGTIRTRPLEFESNDDETIAPYGYIAYVPAP